MGRPFVEAKVGRPWEQKVLRDLIRWVTISPGVFHVAASLGRFFSAVLPEALRRKVATLNPIPTSSPRPSNRQAEQKMTLLAGCVQSAAAPHFNVAAERVFAKIGIDLAENLAAGCCGAVSFHLDAPNEARAQARRNIDAWLAEIEAGAAAVIVTASGCAAFIKDYPDLLAEDAVYAYKARRIADLVRDPVEVLDASALPALRPPAEPKIAVHDPCTLRHGLKLGGRVEALLRGLGYDPQPVRDAHLCCGSAGPYSLLQPAFAKALRTNKLAALTEHDPAAICTANIGCWMHLAEASPTPVRHWIEAVDDVT